MPYVTCILGFLIGTWVIDIFVPGWANFESSFGVVVGFISGVVMEKNLGRE